MQLARREKETREEGREKESGKRQYSARDANAISNCTARAIRFQRGQRDSWIHSAGVFLYERGANFSLGEK